MQRQQITDSKRKRFLKAYAECANIGEAARRAKVVRQTHYDWLKDPEYKREFEEAEQQAVDLLVEEARRRAHDGWEEPIVYQGQIQYVQDETSGESRPATVRKYDSTLLMFLIKARRPEMYRDNWKAEITHRGSMEISQRHPALVPLPDDTLAQVITLLESAHNNGNNGTHSTGVLCGTGVAGEEQAAPDVSSHGTVP